MAKPYIMPLGFIDRKTEAETVFLLTNPQESKNLRLDTQVTVWKYSPDHLAQASPGTDNHRWAHHRHLRRRRDYRGPHGFG